MRPAAGALLRRGLAEAFHAGWLAGTFAEWQRFGRSLADPGRAQEQCLRAIVGRAAGSAWGRHHRFDRIDSIEAFRRAVPVATFESHRAAIDRVRRGERCVLTGEPVERLLPTSGSAAAVKLVPWTKALGQEFGRAVAAWTHDLYRRHPACRGGSAYWSVSPALDPAGIEPPAIESELPIGLEDDASYVGGLLAPLVRRILAVPSSLAAERDHARWRDRTLVALLAAEDLRLVSVWHPTFLSLLLDGLVERWDALLALLASAAPLRARRLAETDPRDLRAIWPSLRVVSAWTDAHAARAAAELLRRLPAEVAFLPKGLLSTEAVITIPFRGARPVAVRSHFVEWIPLGGEASDAVGVEDLRPGERYEVLVTTGGGLYRCRTGDVVECDGFLERTPTLRFLGRADAVSDLRGEKLNDAHVGAAIARLLGDRARFAMLVPTDDALAPRYDLLLEPRIGPDASRWERETLDVLAARLDEALCENPHYRLCRRLGQLAPPEAVVVAADAERRVLTERARRGQRLGDVKPTALARELGWRDLLAP